MLTNDQLQALPKTDLHCHLDGSLRLGSLIELAKAQGVSLPSTTEDGLRELVFKDRYADLGEYLHGFQYLTAVLQEGEALERAAYELCLDAWAEGVAYIEMRFAPQLHLSDDLDIDAVFGAVSKGIQRAESELAADPKVAQGFPAFRAGIIACAMRMWRPGFGLWYRRLAKMFPEAGLEVLRPLASLELARAAVRCRDEHGYPIVGFDLAGQEDGYPALEHQEAYAHAHSHFLNCTVHAGEAYGPESIYQALTALHADRIGHGLTLFDASLCGPEVKDPERYVTRLAENIADQRTTIEVCLTSNLQTNPSVPTVREHPFQEMLERKLSASLCTDNRLVSNTTVTQEFALAQEAFGMSPKQIRGTLIAGFKRSFFPGSYIEKRAYVRRVIDCIDGQLAASDA